MFSRGGGLISKIIREIRYNMTPDERFKFIKNVLNESLEIEKRTKDINPDDNISELKKRIKYSKNPLERKNLERQLNYAYRERKNKDGSRTYRNQRKSGCIPGTI